MPCVSRSAALAVYNSLPFARNVTVPPATTTPSWFVACPALSAFTTASLGVQPLVTCTVESPATRRLMRRSEEHTSELQSRLHLVCRLLLEKKKTSKTTDLT